MLRQVFTAIGIVMAILLSASVGLAGTIIDYSGNGNDGTSYGSVTEVDTMIPGVRAFSFDEGYIRASGLSSAATAGTVAGWVKLNDGYAVNPADWSNAVFLGSTWNPGTLRVELDSLGNLRAVAPCSTGTRPDITPGFPTPAAEMWYHVAFSFGVETGDPSTSKTTLTVTDQLGNVSSYSSSVTYPVAATYDLTDLQFAGMEKDVFGADRDSFLDGQMTDIRVYDTALSASDIALLADTDASTNPTSGNLLLHYYPTAVPEPSTLVLLLGIVLAGCCIRKR